ncbi:ATPase [Mycoplasmopsis californica]|uniref:AAA family ATPase n=1 Tax=Mycoplasmopsis equigenitalium TaxID=114883 RepID=A0ABY5J0W1_9BACT|nr:AAA family ATPase [Mycoplasmopsis equigenitalium]UUD36859.1 AAA family ATPase [Mycoplasmopsis equigenitalium]VEU69846.1 ATPase [Mycoplasmopsis californica]
MSFIKTIRDQLKIKLNIKNILILKGNTQDFTYPNLFDLPIKYENKKLEPNNYINLAEYLTILLHNEKYNDLYYYSPSFTNAIVDEGEIKISTLANEDDNEDDVEDVFSSGQQGEKTFNEFIDTIAQKMNVILENSESVMNTRTAFIIDLSEFIFSDKNQETTLNQIAKVIGLFTNFYSQKTLHYLHSKIKLIFITKNTEIFSSIALKNNEEVQYINIPKPNKEERKIFFKKMKNIIEKFIPDFYEEGDVFEQAVSITDDMSFREILQFIKVLMFNNSTQEKRINNFKDLYRLVNFDKKESEWENIEYDKIAKLENEFKKRIQGQDEAIKAIKNTLIRSFVGLQGAAQSADYVNKPRGILFLAGPTGVGKTEIVKTLSEFVFGDENKIIRFDMSEYNHEESDQKLIGSAPGYVGYEAGGQLTNAVLEKPFSILLFDEIEKANGKILDKFLQILEDGRLTSSKGELVNFSETFIVFTSNIGANNIKDINDKEGARKHFKKEVINYFNNELKRPEILNRIGIKNIIPFNPITEKDVEICTNIIKHKLNKVIKMLKEKRYIINHTDVGDEKELYKQIIKKYDSSLGGRGLVTTLETYFIDPLSSFIFGKYPEIESKLKDENEIVKINYEYKEVSGKKELKFVLN